MFAIYGPKGMELLPLMGGGWGVVITTCLSVDGCSRAVICWWAIGQTYPDLKTGLWGYKERFPCPYCFNVNITIKVQQYCYKNWCSGLSLMWAMWPNAVLFGFMISSQPMTGLSFDCYASLQQRMWLTSDSLNCQILLAVSALTGYVLKGQDGQVGSRNVTLVYRSAFPFF